MSSKHFSLVFALVKPRTVRNIESLFLSRKFSFLFFSLERESHFIQGERILIATTYVYNDYNSMKNKHTKRNKLKKNEMKKQ